MYSCDTVPYYGEIIRTIYIYICMDIQAECADGIGIQIMAAASIPAGVTLVAFEIPGWVIYSRVG